MRQEGLTLGRSDPPDPDHLAEALACLASLFELRLDGRILENTDPLFHRHPETDVHGLLVFWPVADLEPGRHLLEIERRHHDEELPERSRFWAIPFWR